MRKATFPLLILLSVFVLSFTAAISVRPEIYFSKTLIRFKLTSENGAASYSYVEINDIRLTGNTTHIYALDKRKDDQFKSTFTYRLNYWSDSLNWCEDALNYLNCDAVYSSNMRMEFACDSLIYPYSMKVGDTLPTAWATETQLYAETQNVRKIEFKNRKVIGMDSVKQGSVWFKGYSIQSDVTKTSIADYGPLGKIPTELKYTFTVLFAPAHGVIKTVSKTPTGESTRFLLDSK